MIIWRLVLDRLINKQGIRYYLLPLTRRAVFWLLANTLKTQAVHQGYMRDSSKLVLYSDFSCQRQSLKQKTFFFL